MKIVLLLMLLLVAGIAVTLSKRRREARAQAAAALARAKARRPKVPVVSNNLKGVTASQTIQPFRPSNSKPTGDDERAA
jgi:hypothetical protein